jgi:hypothetical protein
MTTYPPNPLGLPASTADAVRKITEDLFKALHDPMIYDGTRELPAVRALWWITKMLNAITGSYDSFGDVPLADLPRAQWEEVLANAGDVADIARVVQATRPWHHEIRVCSVPCARAASADEHHE